MENFSKEKGFIRRRKKGNGEIEEIRIRNGEKVESLEISTPEKKEVKKRSENEKIEKNLRKEIQGFLAKKYQK